MKRSFLLVAVAMLTLAACEKKEENTEINTTTIEPAPAPAPAPAATPADSMGAMSTAGGAMMADTTKK